MLHTLADETEHLGQETNKSKIKVMMENDTPMHVHTTEMNTFESCVLGDNDSATEKNKIRRYKGESLLAAKQWPSTATSSRVILL